jgi:signal transduction histidine kinase
VHISVGIEGDTLVVEVADDGCGFAAGSGDPTGIGLAGMRHRLEAVGGLAELTSAPGGGTRVVFRSPLMSGGDRPSHVHAILHRLRGRRH